MGRSRLWSISWLHHHVFYSHITISDTQARESDDLLHVMSQFFLFLSPLSGAQRILGYVRPWRIAAVHPPKRGKRRSIWRSLRIGTAFVWRCDVICLEMLLWRMQTLNWDTATVNEDILLHSWSSQVYVLLHFKGNGFSNVLYKWILSLCLSQLLLWLHNLSIL